MGFFDNVGKKPAGGKSKSGMTLEELIAAGPGASAAVTDDPYLLPFEVAEDQLVNNRSIMRGRMEPKQTKPRYRASAVTAPLSWSPEKIADLQRAMQKIGLYGDKKVRLGVWDEYDAGAFTELLQAANVEGRTWIEQVAEWRRRPPSDLLDKLKSDQPQRPTIKLSNPLDIKAAARDVSRNTLGREVGGFADAAVSAVQSSERGYQQQLINQDEAGGGGEIITPPSAETILENQVMEQNPEETVAYRMLGTYNSLMQRLGLAG